jgi:hypothetical protein
MASSGIATFDQSGIVSPFPVVQPWREKKLEQQPCDGQERRPPAGNGESSVSR